MAEADGRRDTLGSATFKRHGPEPPENDSGPTPSDDEAIRHEAGRHAEDERRPSLDPRPNAANATRPRGDAERARNDR